jgi:hypothetical protein
MVGMRVPLSLIPVFFCLTLGLAQPGSILDAIQSNVLTDIDLTLDWKQLDRKRKDKAYFEAEMTCTGAGRDTIRLDGRIRTRGARRLEICSRPPLKVKFDKNDLARMGFSPMNEIDVVHPCQDPAVYEQYILREYLAYKLWEIISPYTFRTQLVRIHYTSPDGSAYQPPATAFLLEDPEEVATRLSGREYGSEVISQNALETRSVITMNLFQFMIGNTDWFVTNRHNLDFFGFPGHTLLVTVPYDFDYCGLVNAPYASHHESLDLTSVTIRYYQGKCYPEEEVLAALDPFLANKAAILDAYKAIPGLDERSVRHVTEYLQEFYDIVESPKKFEQQVLRHCDMWPAKK